MKKTLLVIMISMLTFVGKSYAEMAYGVSLALTQINASGSETEGGETNSKSIHKNGKKTLRGVVLEEEEKRTGQSTR